MNQQVKDLCLLIYYKNNNNKKVVALWHRGSYFLTAKGELHSPAGPPIRGWDSSPPEGGRALKEGDAPQLCSQSWYKLTPFVIKQEEREV